MPGGFKNAGEFATDFNGGIANPSSLCMVAPAEPQRNFISLYASSGCLVADDIVQAVRKICDAWFALALYGTGTTSHLNFMSAA